MFQNVDVKVCLKELHELVLNKVKGQFTLDSVKVTTNIMAERLSSLAYIFVGNVTTS
jgi:hypothetical protein